MKTFRFSWTIGIALTLAAFALGACSSPGSPPASAPPPVSGSTVKAPSNGVAQTHSGGNVTIVAKWLGTQDSSLSFRVVMDTHSIDLDQYDLGKLAVLRDDAGREYTPSAWLAPPGGHHREGNLTFPVPEAVRQGTASSVQLLIRGVAGMAERALLWQLG